jgi:hypothetical protein
MPTAPDLRGVALDDRYELVEAIGEGAFGRVYRGQDRRLQRAVAIKVIKPWWTEDPTWVAAFERETRLLARLTDPGIVSIFDVGHAPEGLYYVSELVEGESLAQRLGHGGGRGLSPAEATLIAQQLCRALGSAHALSIVHRDVKPANVLIAVDGSVKLADFGVAKLAEGSTAGSIGAGVVGTPKYMAPEQSRDGLISPATDVYSAGVVLYEMLAGRPPFEAVSAVELAVAHLQELPPPLPDGVGAALGAVVMRALAKDPQDRYPGGTAMADALAAAALQAPTGGEGPDATARQPRRAPRANYAPASRRRNITVTVAVIVLIVALAITAIIGAGRPGAARRAAPRPVQVPLLVGRTVTVARTRLRTLHLRVRVHDVPAPGVRPGTVTSQKPVAGHSVKARTRIRLSVSEVPRFRQVATVTTAHAAPIRIRGERWRIASTVSSADHCTLLVLFCKHTSATVLRVGTGGTTSPVASFGLSDGSDQLRVFDTGPGTYELRISPATGDTKYSIAVDDDY